MRYGAIVGGRVARCMKGEFKIREVAEILDLAEKMRQKQQGQEQT